MDELEELIRGELDQIKDPCSLAAGQPMGLSEMGLVKEVRISPQGNVEIVLRLTSPFCHMIGFFKKETTRRISQLQGVQHVTMRADDGLDWTPRHISPEAARRREAALARLTQQATSTASSTLSTGD